MIDFDALLELHADDVPFDDWTAAPFDELPDYGTTEEVLRVD